MNDLNQQKNAVIWLRILYPLWAIVGMFSLMYVPSTLIDKSNPALTAENIINSEMLFRLGITGSLFTQLISIAVVWYLYQLFYHTYKEAFVLTALFNFLGMPITMVSIAKLISVLDVLDKPDLVIQLINSQIYGTVIASIFWGLWLLPLGYMVIKSQLFPSILGWLLIVAGIGYTVSAFLYFLGFKGTLIMEILDLLTMGEVLWMLWVMVLGARWKNLENT